ncbi:acyl-CoA dehydrogenase family protein [Acidiferrimicrobium sp. IK]|uniref:acyl-CoA dehydrogenase family protein n=1 Tax=Acidiferrimicrobium sp. IK TaxID=2871700 RepID=UPI0021CAFCC3|nr:acyl-CoA dehydrogenase family protein [Acidiferrimicrobium sp. IK]MCU4183438.1 acyl-CoA dehydrogenase family protein [Acidiferrimicrobium sp. IK]
MDVDAPVAPPEYDPFRASVRAFVAEHAPPRPEQRKAGMRTPEDAGEVAALQQWLGLLHRAGYSPLELAAGTDPWPARVAIEEIEAAGAPWRIGNPLVETALTEHGTADQQQRFLSRLRAGEDIWCQLYSEPDAGSDLASLTTRAVRDGDRYVVNGQKVWTTWAQWSDYGYLLARTDPAADKHAGITAFAIDMRQPGVEVRPLREMTGTSDFNEVFFTDAVVSVADRIGEEGQGWAIASRSLMSERSRQGSGDRDMCEQVKDLVALGTPGLVDTAGLVRLYERAHVLRLLEHTMASRAALQQETPADAPVLKTWFSTLNLDVAEEALRLLGSRSVLVEGDAGTEANGRWQDMWLYARGYTISAGSNEVMRNLIAERALGMPRDRAR